MPLASILIALGLLISRTLKKRLLVYETKMEEVVVGDGDALQIIHPSLVKSRSAHERDKEGAKKAFQHEFLQLIFSSIFRAFWFSPSVCEIRIGQKLMGNL